MSNISETIERLESIFDRLEIKLDIVQPQHQAKSELCESFMASIKLAAKPGMRIND